MQFRSIPAAADSHQRGAAAIEFAIVLPVLIVLVFGIVEFGRGFNAKIELTGAIREGARALALGKTVAEAETAVTDAAPSLDPGDITFAEETTCPNDDDQATITAQYPVAYSIPLLSEGTFELSVTGVMRCGV